ncbi:MAG: UDP-N-acetylglucosamine--N-acetylmuramyl-(pentapeptide) pyrophosphoryl-undecaprenol N-acetylglucosamine transferase, partial [Spirochaetota bacterium]
MKKPLIAFTGGGSGGHVFPGLAVLNALPSDEFDFVWIGGRNGMERHLVRRAGVPFVGVPAGKLRRYFSRENIGDVFRVLASIFRSRRELKRLAPLVLFSKGGFASVPPVIAAASLRIPVLTHESDSDPGLATKINARFADKILVAYGNMEGFFPVKRRRRVVVTGNPLRREVFDGKAARGWEFLGEPAGSKPLLLILGGSLGARQINEAISARLGDLSYHWTIAHQTGSAWAPSEPTRALPGYHSFPFLREELPDLLAAADVVVCRAGASTLWECAALEKAMVVVPLVIGSRGDQVRNAARFGEAGAAVVITEQETLADALQAELGILCDD